MSKSKFVSPYDGSTRRVPFATVGDSLTQQNAKDECDVNFIIRKYHKTGLITHARDVAATYADFDAFDFHSAMNIIAEAQASFDDLPANVRKDFHNSPAEFMDFLNNPANRDKAIEYGFIEADAPDAAPAASGAPQTTAQPASANASADAAG